MHEARPQWSPSLPGQTRSANRSSRKCAGDIEAGAAHGRGLVSCAAEEPRDRTRFVLPDARANPRRQRPDKAAVIDLPTEAGPVARDQVPPRAIVASVLPR